MNPEMNTGARSPGKEPSGAMFSIIVVSLVIIAGAYYFFRNIPFTLQNAPQTTQEEADTMLAALSQQDSSDEITSIQKDIGSTPDLSKIGDGLVGIQL